MGFKAQRSHSVARSSLLPLHCLMASGLTATLDIEADCVLNAYWYAQFTVSQLARPRARSDDAHRYKVTRSPDAADLSMAAMSSWRRTASAKSGTV